MTTCGFCARAGFDECFCKPDPVEDARTAERERLRPLLERCEEVIAGLWRDLERENGPHPTLTPLLTDLRRELGKE